MKSSNLILIVGGAALLAVAARKAKAADNASNEALDDVSDAAKRITAAQAEEADEAASAAKAAGQLELRARPQRRMPPPPPMNEGRRAQERAQEPHKAPDGYDPAKARKTASGLAQHLQRKGADYDRRLVRAWQTAAALASDGIYGGATRGALLYYGIASPPKALFRPTATIPYHPPE